MKPGTFPDRWLHGYCCAIAKLIEMDGQVETNARELFRSGVGRETLKSLKAQGVDESDLKTFKKHWKELQ